MRSACPPSAGGVLSVIALLAALSCDSASDKAPSRPATAASAAPSSTERNAKSVWYGTCAKCHTTTELAGKSVSDMKKALQTVPLMRRYQGSFSDAELQAVQRMLAGS